MTTWVVFEARIGSRIVWGWGRVASGPGFEEILYTERDGFSAAMDLEAAPQFTKHLFTVSTT